MPLLPDRIPRLLHVTAAALLLSALGGNGNRLAAIETKGDLASRLEHGSAAERSLALEEVKTLGSQGSVYVPHIITLLAADDVGLRYEAAITLEAIGPQASASVPALLKLLEGSDILIAHQSLVALRAIGGDPAALSRSITPLLKSEDPLLRTEAAATLVGLNPTPSPEVLQVLAQGLTAEQAVVQSTAINGLSAAGPAAVKPVQSLLKSKRIEDQLAALEVLENLGPSARETVTDVIALEEASTSAKVLAAGAETLGAVATLNEKVVPVLLKLATHEDAAVRLAALHALGQLKSASAETVALLEKSLGDTDVLVRIAACDALGQLGAEAKAALPELVKALRDPSGAVTLHAAESLGRLGAPALPELQKLLADPEYGLLALQTLESMGPAARSAAPAVVKTLDNPGPLPLRAICLTLAAIGADPKVAGPSLKKVLHNPESEGRGAAAYALGRIGDRSAIRDLTNVVEDKDPRVQLAAVWALLILEPGHPEHLKIALPRLIEGLERPEEPVRLQIVQTLGTLGSKASAAVPALVKHLETDDSLAVRMAAATALAEIDGSAEGVLPKLLTLAQSPELPVRQTAIYAIGRYGKKAQKAQPQLEQLVRAVAAPERKVAAWALLQVAPGAATSELTDPILVSALSEREPPIVVALLQAASQSPHHSPAFLESLKALTTSDDPALRAAALGAWDRLHP